YLPMTLAMRKDLAVGDHLRRSDLRFLLRLPDSRSVLSFDKADVIANYGFAEEYNYEMFELCVERFKQFFLHFQIGNFFALNAVNVHLKKKNDEEVKRKI